MNQWYEENEKVNQFVKQTLELAVEKKLTLSEIDHIAIKIQNKMRKYRGQLNEKTLDTIVTELDLIV